MRAVVLVTGMSGTGKSAVLAELARRGHRVVDTDHGGWIDESGPERLWRHDRIDALLTEHRHGSLFVAGCVANQGDFTSRLDAVVLLSAPLDTILERVATRTANAFGRNDADRQRIISDHAEIEPLLRTAASVEIDTRRPLDGVADELERIARFPRNGPPHPDPVDAAVDIDPAWTEDVVDDLDRIVDEPDPHAAEHRHLARRRRRPDRP